MIARLLPRSSPATGSFEEAVASPHMPALDGFRAIAAFSVVLAHGYGLTLFDGVTAFFVLSGFLITTLLLRELDSTGAVSLRAFYARRTLRIFPAYYACVLASFTIDRLAGNPWPAGLAASASAYVVNYFNAFNGHPSTSVAHLWSLGVEEQFYLLWPAVFLVLSRGGRTTLRAGLVALILGGIAWRLVLYLSGWVDQAYLYNAFDARFDNLAVGCLLATVVSDPRAGAVVRRVAAFPWAPVVTFVMMYLLLENMPSITRHLVGFTLYSLLIAVLLVQLLHVSSSRLWRWLDSLPMRFLGTISYPIYLYHGWGLGLGAWFTMLSPFGQFVVGTCLTVVGATASYLIVERPFLSLKKHFAPGRHRRSARVAADLVTGPAR
jgi:peptidoglycan/LPS O-acetylase OafA/YrhL